MEEQRFCLYLGIVPIKAQNSLQFTKNQKAQRLMFLVTKIKWYLSEQYHAAYMQLYKTNLTNIMGPMQAYTQEGIHIASDLYGLQHSAVQQTKQLYPNHKWTTYFFFFPCPQDNQLAVSSRYRW